MKNNNFNKKNLNKKHTEEKGQFVDINFKKSLGQNFLSDKNLLNKIGEYGDITKNDNVLEIGAGAGTLTEVLATKAKAVLSFEVDKNLQEKLEVLQDRFSNLNFVFQDFMTANLNTIYSGERFKVVANIPYYITTPIIFKLMEIADRIDTMIFMVQKEVAVRFASNENCKEYGITSVVLQSVADVKLLRVVKRECFTPAPNVDSALIEIRINKAKFNLEDFEGFSRFVHNCFSMRRKTLVNNLIKNYSIDKQTFINAIMSMGYNEAIRPEQISVENFVKLYKSLFLKK